LLLLLQINDDWRQYALFICYGSTERCLSYDEKPLLLFQRLKEASQNPVFMLRHIKDIKSPIALASAKSAARKEKKRRGDESGTAGDRPTTGEGPHPQPMPGAGEAGIGFALSIYPYTSEREDEFDVTVGDTFVILSKVRDHYLRCFSDYVYLM
jgi:hypothetical protein